MKTRPKMPKIRGSYQVSGITNPISNRARGKGFQVLRKLSFPLSW